MNIIFSLSLSLSDSLSLSQRKKQRERESVCIAIAIAIGTRRAIVQCSAVSSAAMSSHVDAPEDQKDQDDQDERENTSVRVALQVQLVTSAIQHIHSIKEHHEEEEARQLVIGLQLPPSLLHTSATLPSILLAELKRTHPDINASFIINGDCHHARCCPDELTMSRVGANLHPGLLVHYAPLGCCFTAQTRSMPVVVVHGRQTTTLAREAIHRALSVIVDIEKADTPHEDDTGHRDDDDDDDDEDDDDEILVVYSGYMHESVRRILPGIIERHRAHNNDDDDDDGGRHVRLCPDEDATIWCGKQVQMRNRYELWDSDGDESCTTSGLECVGGRTERRRGRGARIVIAGMRSPYITPVHFGTALRTADASEEHEYESNGDKKTNGTVDDDDNVDDDGDDSDERGERGEERKRRMLDFSVAGLRFSLPEKWCGHVIFIGDAESDALRSIELAMHPIQVHVVHTPLHGVADPTTDGGDATLPTSMPESRDGNARAIGALLRRRLHTMQLASQSSIVGLLIATASPSVALMDAHDALREWLNIAGVRTYTVSVGAEPSPVKLCNFPEVDAWIALACSMAGGMRVFENAREFMRPVLTAHEAVLAFAGRVKRNEKKAAARMARKHAGIDDEDEDDEDDEDDDDDDEGALEASWRTGFVPAYTAVLERHNCIIAGLGAVRGTAPLPMLRRHRRKKALSSTSTTTALAKVPDTDCTALAAPASGVSVTASDYFAHRTFKGLEAGPAIEPSPIYVGQKGRSVRYQGHDDGVSS